MKHLFILRHGEYDCDGLNDCGREQIGRVAEEMKSLVGLFNGHYLVSSPAIRTKQSADIIRNVFGLESFDTNKSLFTSDSRDLSEKMLKTVDTIIEPHTGTNDVVTIMAHYETCNSYPRYVLQRFFEVGRYMERPKKGEGIYINIETSEHKLISAA